MGFIPFGASYLPFLYPTGDTSGAGDPARVAAALRQAGAVRLAPGSTFYGASTVAMGPGDYLYADPSVTWNNIGSGYAFSLTNPGSYSAAESAAIAGGFTIDCQSGSQGGIQFGDVIAAQINVFVVNTTGIGAHALNGNWYSEWNNVTARFSNCAQGLVFERTGSGTNSYDRSRYTIYTEGTQIPVQLGGTSGDVALTQGALKVFGNIGSTGTCTLILFATADSVIEYCELQAGAESDGTAQTVNFHDSTNKIRNCYGTLSFANGTGIWTASNDNGNILGYTGLITGDTTLQTAGDGSNVSNLATSLPTGWSGNLQARLTSSGDILLAVELAIANGTVVTTGESVQTGIGVPWKPAANKYLSCFLSGQTSPVPVQISSGGAFTYQGPGFTASGIIFLYGQGTYPNQY